MEERDGRRMGGEGRRKGVGGAHGCGRGWGGKMEGRGLGVDGAGECMGVDACAADMLAASYEDMVAPQASLQAAPGQCTSRTKHGWG